MENRENAYRGCLLGLAIGDAMGYTVDRKTWEEIKNDYGPNGLLGYDLTNGFADVSSYTQLAAFCANGLLAGITRGQVRGKMAPFIRYAEYAIGEWGKVQHIRRTPDTTFCWVCRVSQLRLRRCMDTRMLDTLSRGRCGSPEEPVNKFDSTGSITTAIPVGLFFDERRMEPHEIGRLGAEVVALTHGDSLSFLSGAAVSYIIAGIVQDKETPLREHFAQAAEVVAAQFGRQYPQALELKSMLLRTMDMAHDPSPKPQEVMENMKCDTCAQVLCGAVYACSLYPENFDGAMITAVNHSGRSAAVGAIAGAILGAKMGAENIPEFYLESLEVAETLCELAEDMAQGCPVGGRQILFDDTWDQKYVHGQLVDHSGWATE